MFAMPIRTREQRSFKVNTGPYHWRACRQNQFPEKLSLLLFITFLLFMKMGTTLHGQTSVFALR